MFTIKVIDKYGEPAYYKEIAVRFSEFPGNFSKDKKTDRNGEVYFDEKKDRGTVYVDGKNCGEYDLNGRVVIYLD
jgi:hypothetical protein